jgi:hypothetical protein
VPVAEVKHDGAAGHDADAGHGPEGSLEKTRADPLFDLSRDSTGVVTYAVNHANHAAPTYAAAVEYGADGKPKEKPIGYYAAYGYTTYDFMSQAKRAWLNPTFFSVRLVLYFVIWSAIARHFYALSREQDRTGDPDITRRLSARAPLTIVVFALSVTFAVFDLLMSLDHHWYSTIFGVYYFAGAMIATFATAIVALNVLHRGGFLTRSVNVEHFHDLGKFLFGFTFFWGYIAFSQYMLQWYASILEATPWWIRRGASTAEETVNPEFAGLSIVLLVGHFLIPFPFLLSRHIKRNRVALLCGAVWLLVMCWIDLFWLVMPELNNGVWYFGIPEIGCAVGLIGLFVAIVVSIARHAPLRPLKDPRLHEAVAFHNI